MLFNIINTNILQVFFIDVYFAILVNNETQIMNLKIKS